LPVIRETNVEIIGELQKNVTITIQFFSNPEYTHVKWTKGQENIDNLSGSRFLSIVTNSVVVLPFNDKYITFLGKNVTLFIQSIDASEFINYTLNIKNIIGEKKYTVKVVPAGM